MSKTKGNPSEIVSELRNTFNAGKTRPVAFRRKQLQSLLRLYQEHGAAINAVLGQDLHKPKTEAIIMETQYLINDLENTLANLDKWTAPDRPPKELANILDSLYVYKEPYGVVLVIGAWNYPIQLTMLPVAGAIAAGNCVVIKPSEVAPASSKWMAEMLPKYLDSSCYRVYEGGVAETTLLLQQKFDYIFYTGSSNVGKIVHQAANAHLTPVTLELGGKSPVFIDSSANLEVTAKRLLWGKFANAGQTCVAPDYVLITPEIQLRFIEQCKRTIQLFFGPNPRNSPDFGRIVNGRHFQRVVRMIQGSKVAVGGESDPSDLYVAPTVLTDVNPDDPVMTDEIFGPILPILTVGNVYEAAKFINARDKPLALYIFSNRTADVELLIQNTSCGGICVNDTVMQMATDMPFGGVGMSGMGVYHGKHTFDTFTHAKSCLWKPLGGLGEVLGAARYPPYTETKRKFISMLLKKRNGVRLGWLKYALVFAVGYLCAAYGVRDFVERVLANK